MKKIWAFLLGVVTGAVLMIVVAAIIANFSPELQNDGITIFPEKGECLNYNQYKVFQVLDSGSALASSNDYFRTDKLDVLFINKDGRYHYDDEIITVPKGKCIRQIGVYKYNTKMGERTVPIVDIFDKK